MDFFAALRDAYEKHTWPGQLQVAMRELRALDQQADRELARWQSKYTEEATASSEEISKLRNELYECRERIKKQESAIQTKDKLIRELEQQIEFRDSHIEDLKQAHISADTTNAHLLHDIRELNAKIANLNLDRIRRTRRPLRYWCYDQSSTPFLP